MGFLVTEKKKRSQFPPQCTCTSSLSHNNGMRSHGTSSKSFCQPHVFVWLSLSLSLLPHSLPPCQPQPLRGPPQWRCDLRLRPSWAPFRHSTQIQGEAHHRAKREKEENIRGLRMWGAIKYKYRRKRRNGQVARSKNLNFKFKVFPCSDFETKQVISRQVSEFASDTI